MCYCSGRNYHGAEKSKPNSLPMNITSIIKKGREATESTNNITNINTNISYINTSNIENTIYKGKYLKIDIHKDVNGPVWFSFDLVLISLQSYDSFQTELQSYRLVL